MSAKLRIRLSLMPEPLSADKLKTVSVGWVCIGGPLESQVPLVLRLACRRCGKGDRLDRTANLLLLFWEQLM